MDSETRSVAHNSDNSFSSNTNENNSNSTQSASECNQSVTSPGDGQCEASSTKQTRPKLSNGLFSLSENEQDVSDAVSKPLSLTPIGVSNSDATIGFVDDDDADAEPRPRGSAAAATCNGPGRTNGVGGKRVAVSITCSSITDLNT